MLSEKHEMKYSLEKDYNIPRGINPVLTIMYADRYTIYKELYGTGTQQKKVVGADKDKLNKFWKLFDESIIEQHQMKFLFCNGLGWVL